MVQLLANNNAAGGGRRRRRDLGPGCGEQEEVRSGHRAAATIMQGFVNAVDDQGEWQTCEPCLTM